jgi:Fur family transcriptional regulator, ferric uptake regulator
MDCRHHSEARHRAALPDLTDKLRKESRKVTGPRQAILRILRAHPHPMSVKEIHAGLAQEDCNLATVYRCIHLLQAIGMVKRFDFGDNVARFELLAEGDDGHHHHLICTSCAEVIELGECSIRELENLIAARSGFQRVTHKLEFFGLCPGCQENSP